MNVPPPDVPSPEDDSRVEALRAARTAPTQLKVARLYPELRPPYVFLSGDENRALERLYWRGENHTLRPASKHSIIFTTSTSVGVAGNAG